MGFWHGEELSEVHKGSDLVRVSINDGHARAGGDGGSGERGPQKVSDVGGPKEVVKDGETGIVVAAGDVGAWVERVVGLVRDEGRRRKMGVARTSTCRSFRWARSFEHFWGVHVAAAEAARQKCAGQGPGDTQPGPRTKEYSIRRPL